MKSPEETPNPGQPADASAVGDFPRFSAAQDQRFTREKREARRAYGAGEVRCSSRGFSVRIRVDGVRRLVGPFKTLELLDRAVARVKASVDVQATRAAAVEGSLEHAYAHPPAPRDVYLIWAQMLARCYDQRHESWPDYGGRGIRVHPHWCSAPGSRLFYAHIGPRPSLGHSVDRIDNDGHYAPGNVRWATRVQQAANKGRRLGPLAIALLTLLALTLPACLPAVDPDPAPADPCAPVELWTSRKARRTADECARPELPISVFVSPDLPISLAVELKAAVADQGLGESIGFVGWGSPEEFAARTYVPACRVDVVPGERTKVVQVGCSYRLELGPAHDTDAALEELLAALAGGEA